MMKLIYKKTTGENMRKRDITIFITGMICLASCNSGSTTENPSSTTDDNNLPLSYQCMPSNMPVVSKGASIKLAYAANCSVATAPESTILQEMAVALETYNVKSEAFKNNCTGTPLSYNSSTGIGFVLTAAHCVQGGVKPANTEVTQDNISIYNNDTVGHNSAWIYQGNVAAPIIDSESLTAEILAVYIPSEYCEVPAFTNGGCSYLPKANGDFAVLKVKTQNGYKLNVSNLVSLAPINYVINSDDFLLALGYGGTNTNGTPAGLNPQNPNLNYINYQYFATDYFQGESGQKVLMNGFYASNLYYGIICQGDSGGGDFAWNGSSWYLIGVHSYGSDLCGGFSYKYESANDASADVRQYYGWIQNVITNDSLSAGCAPLGSAYVCKSGNGE